MFFLSAVLDSLREISSNAYDAAGRIQNLIESLTDSVRHVGMSLFWTEGFFWGFEKVLVGL